jgi:hypothetical protein
LFLIVLFGIGIMIGAVAYRSVRWFRQEMSRPSFVSSGFEFARCGPFEGWLNRDPANDDWIMWSHKEQRMFRGSTPDAFLWAESPESKEQCIQLGREYSQKNREAMTSGRLRLTARK